MNYTGATAEKLEAESQQRLVLILSGTYAVLLGSVQGSGGALQVDALSSRLLFVQHRFV